MKPHKQLGFAALEGLLILVILALIGFVGYWVYNAQNTSDSLYRNSASQQNGTSAAAAPVINSASDLNQAEQALDKVNPDDSNSDSSQLSSQLSGF